jgi:hypothetical protein
MNAYIYQAALLCEECALKTGRVFARPDESEDSDCFPVGPLPNGGGEADCPEHCDHCGVFLENPLTTDGYECVRFHVASNTNPTSVALSVWAPFYL